MIAAYMDKDISPDVHSAFQSSCFQVGANVLVLRCGSVNRRSLPWYLLVNHQLQLKYHYNIGKDHVTVTLQVLQLDPFLAIEVQVRFLHDNY
jgi:hypothetical protein